MTTQKPVLILADFSPLVVDKLQAALRGHGLQGMAEFRRDPAQTAGASIPGAAGEERSLRRPLRVGALIECLEKLTAQDGRRELAVGPYTLHETDKTLHRPGAPPIPLTDREAEILACLARAEGAVVAREVLLRDVWGFRNDLETHTLETHIYRLRRKIEADPAQPAFILTRGNGYCLAV